MAVGVEHPAAGRTSAGAARLIGLDVTRAVALIGVVVMNYIGAMVAPDARRDFVDRLFHPYIGVLATRFAATFVVVAGIGISLLTRSARASADPRVRREMSLRLVRRGVLLYAVGYFLDFHWPGTILFYYGAYFVLAAVLYRWSTRAVVVVGVLSALGAVFAGVLATWQATTGRDSSWYVAYGVSSFRDLAVRTFLDYTHPVLPWLAFLCAGLVIGRHLDSWRVWRTKVVAAVVAAEVVIYAFVSVLDATDSRRGEIVYRLTSMHPYDRSIFYTASTLGIAILAVVAITSLAERYATSLPVVQLQRAGQMTLSLYFLHVLAYYVAVRWTGGITTYDLVNALGLGIAFWILAIAVGSWWHHRIGRGPAEIAYRAFGG